GLAGDATGVAGDERDEHHLCSPLRRDAELVVVVAQVIGSRYRHDGHDCNQQREDEPARKPRNDDGGDQRVDERRIPRTCRRDDEADADGAPPDPDDRWAEWRERVALLCNRNYLNDCPIWAAAGPSTITKTGGKMNKISGNRILTGSFAAFSLAHCRRLFRIS